VSAPFKPLRRPVRLKGSAGGTAKPRLDSRRPRDTDPISTDTRIFVWQRDGGKCRNCGSRQQLHFDHIIPQSWGGSSTVENIQLLCQTCNLKKGASLIDGGVQKAGG
jgi:5-methylcytosine-specific restriction endonuclease McrA